MIGDLREEHARYARRASAPRRPSRWHLRQSLGIAVRYGMMRMLRRKPPVRWISLAAAEPEGPWWSGLTRDVLYARRAIVQRPLLSFTVVVTLALALAANSTTFSLMDALVLRPYRFAGVDRLVVATTVAPDANFIDRINVTAADFREWREQSTHRQGLGDVPVVGRQPVRRGRSRAGARRSLCRRDSSSCWASTPIMGRAFTRERGAAGPASSRRARPRTVGPAIRIRSEHRRQERAAGRRAVRSRRRCAAGLHHSRWRRVVGADCADRSAMGRPPGRELRRLRPAGRRRDRRAGARRAHDDRRHPAARPSGDQRPPLRAPDVVHERHGRSRRRRVHRHLAGRRPAVAVDRVRQHRQLADGARRRAIVGVRVAARARRQPRADLHADTDRRAAAVARSR